MVFSAKTFARKATVASLLSLMLASCVVVEDGPGPGPRPPRPDPGPQFCTREYDPVCARRGGDRQTFANSCMAEAAGYRIIRGGECRGGGDDGWGGGGGGGRGDQFCTREYRPVCGRRGDTLRTFPNACEADSSGYRVIDDRGPC
ncbi:Kazal-type serine protease inhibitor domain-containing protein [Aminobacter sp. BA135]|uniref:Kazal-type serine protease inhibitor domain-containing protein n=1 Tax=Aminobacter sp. BA135 TaxID=537596 RepID=UPI003D7A24B2